MTTSRMSQPRLRVAIYARFSTDKQRDASIEDQIDSCRELAAREGWEIVATYQGSSRISRSSTSGWNISASRFTP
jgi:DNA invertase Pin-like site-specific DNA recombinase